MLFFSSHRFFFVGAGIYFVLGVLLFGIHSEVRLQAEVAFCLLAGLP